MNSDRRLAGACLVLAGLFGWSFSLPTSAGAAKNVFQDTDWNVAFYDNCGLPQSGSVAWIVERGSRYLRFQIKDGDVGRCSSDRRARSGAPYWERAELKQISPLRRNTRYVLSFRVRFAEGFAGDRESFWQIHAHNRNCPAKPPILVKFSNGRLVLSAQRIGGGHESYYSDIRIADLVGKWIDMKLTFDTSDNAMIAWHMDGGEVISNKRFWIEPCGKPHFKFGIYRPGKKSGNRRSVADFDKIDLRVVGKIE